MITTPQKVITVLVKEFSVMHTATTLSQQLKMSRQGMWKIVKKLQQQGIIKIKPAGIGKTSTQTISLDWSSSLTEKTLALALAQEAASQKRWSFTFGDLEPEVDFLIIFGSILITPKTAGDIDLLSVAKEKQLSSINKQIFSIQKTQEKKIHAHNFTAEEFSAELQKPNKVFLDALRRGTVLFGQEKFIMFMKRFSQ